MNTRPIGIFNYAKSYRIAALELRELGLRTTHPDAPVLFLMNHAIELYFKSYLHAKGLSERELGTYPYSHKLLNLAWAAKQRGLCPSEETYAVARVLESQNAQIEARYLNPGLKRPIRDEVLDRAALDLHRSVGIALRRLGFTIRL